MHRYLLVFLLASVALLFLGCEEEEQAECDVECGFRKANFERLTTRVLYSSSYYARTHIDVIKTETGAKVKYYQIVYGENPVDLEMELSLDEWFDFLGALFKCNTHEWEKEYDKQPSTPPYIHGFLGSFNRGWNLEIYSSEKHYSKTYKGRKVYPPNWDEFIKIMNDMEDKIKARGENKNVMENF